MTLAPVCHPRRMTPGTRGGLAVIVGLMTSCLTGALLNYTTGAFIGLGAGLIIILAVPAKAKDPSPEQRR